MVREFCSNNNLVCSCIYHLHKQTTKLVSTLQERGVQVVVTGDVRDIRKDLHYGAMASPIGVRYAL